MTAPSFPRIYDISPVISPRLGVWPGDSSVSREVLMDIAKGDSVTLSTIRATVHLGSHADGPNHYGKDAPDIAARPLHHYLGPCNVIDARAQHGRRIGLSDITLPDVLHRRVLFRTGTFPNPDEFNTDFAALDPMLIDTLASRGVFTIGIDTPSVDLFDSKDLPSHHTFLKHDMAILEGLVLRDVPLGEYELIALPLRLQGFDASPVRAVLRELPGTTHTHATRPFRKPE